MKFSHVILAILWVLGFVLAFGDFGFDHVGRFGLDFDDFLGMLFIYAVVFAVGFIEIVGRRDEPETRRIWYLDFALLIGSAVLHLTAAVTLN